MSNKKHFFNMVEVALALLVISLGLSTVLTLFPAGLKATREAENANNLVEAAEYAFVYLQTLVNDASKNDLAEIKTAGADSKTHDALNSAVRIEEKSDGTYIYHKSIKQAGGSDYIEDFSCVIRILDAEKGMSGTDSSGSEVIALPLAQSGGAGFSVDGNSFKLLAKGDSFGSAGGKNVSDVVKVLNVELSYPAGAPYDGRTKRTFRMVFLSNTFTPHE